MTGPGWPSAREIMAFSVVALFAFAFVKNPNDQTIVGAMIAAFAGAWGFYLGGSKVGSDTAVANARTVTESARTASNSPQPVIVTNPPEAPVQTEEARP